MGKCMINYSVYLANNPLKPEAAAKAYARNQVDEVWSIEKFARHIADHRGVYSRGTVKGVIADMCDCIVEQLLEGKKVQLGELGTFGVSLSCEGAESIEKFTAKNIRSVNIIFTPGTEFENLVDRAEFNLITSRAIQVASLKALKDGEDTLDLSALRKPGATPDDGSKDPATPDPTNPDGGGGQGGSSTGGDGGDSGTGGDDEFV